MSEITIPCAGFIILSEDNSKTILVSTHRGNLSFPKGKRNKKETTMETALRELNEETGLTENDICQVDDIFLDELSNNGNPSIRYFLAHIKDQTHKFTFDSKELKEVKWYDCEKIKGLDNIKNKRKKVLYDALEIIK